MPNPIKDPNKDPSKKAVVPRQRIVVQPEEMGLTARIRRALLDQQFGLTTRIRKAMQGTKDPKSMIFLHKNHLVLLIIFAAAILFLLLWKRSISIDVMRSDGSVALSDTVDFSLLEGSKIKVNAKPEVVKYYRVDIYGNDLDPTEFTVYRKGQPVSDKLSLEPGEYELRVNKKDYKPLVQQFSVGKEQNVIIKLEPTVSPSVKITFLIEDKLYPDSQISPDDVIITGTQKSIKDGFIKRGSYTVDVSKEGYHSQTFQIDITSDGEVKKFPLRYKSREIVFTALDTSKGVEVPINTEEIKLRSKESGESLSSFDGRSILPGEYDLTVTKDGFEPFKDSLKIYPGKDRISKKLPMTLRERPFVVHVSYDTLPPSVDPDKCYLQNLVTGSVTQIKKDTKVFPGRYMLHVEKSGYTDSNKEIDIQPSSSTYEERVSLYYASIVVALKIEGDFRPQPKVEPDELGSKFDVKKKGYMPATAEKPLNPTAKFQTVPINMQTIPRKVIAIITNDIDQSRVTPDMLSLTPMDDRSVKGDPVEIDGQKTFKPGEFQLNIQKVGFKPIKEGIIIYPDVGDYILEKKLSAVDRKLLYKLDSDYKPDVPITPDRVTVDTKENLEPDISLRPGSYNLILYKDGYEPLKKEIKVEAGVEPYLIQGRFISKPRVLVYDIKDEGGKLLSNYEVSFSGTPYKAGDRIKPAMYSTDVKKLGYDIWTKSISIEPSEKEYILTAILNAKPRLIDLKVKASFPEDAEIIPSKALLNQTDITPAAGFKPGDYTLTIAKEGYKTIKEQIQIEPSEDPFPIYRTMNPEPRPIKLVLSVDVEAEEVNAPYNVTMTPTGKEDRIPIEDGKTVIPNDYQTMIQRSGYKEIRRSDRVLPAVEPYEIKASLEALPRDVEVIVMADFPEERVTPDIVKIGSYDLIKPGPVPPGAYDLTINKAGYGPINEHSVKVPAGLGIYKITRQIKCMPRLVAYEIRDQESQELLTPTSVTLDGAEVTGNTRFTPRANYVLKVVVPGYTELQKRIPIPPGEGTYVIKEFLISSMRLVTYKIDGDFEPGKEFDPEDITLTNVRVDKSRSFRPGEYDLVISHPGYKRVAEKMQLTSGKTPYEIKRTLISKERKLVLDIQGDYPPDVKVTPTRLTFGTAAVKEGDMIKPGRYSILIYKEGFDEKDLKEVIPPSEDDYLLRARLVSRPRKVEFLVTGDYLPGKPLDADEIILGTEKVKDRCLVRPGEYNVSVSLAGYETARFKERILPGTETHNIKCELVSIPRPVEITVTGDYPKGEKITPDSMTIDKRDVEGNVFKPRQGTSLEIAKGGYKKLEEKLDIPPGVGPLKLTRELLCLARPIEFDITYNIMPPSGLGKTEIFLKDEAGTEKRRMESDVVNTVRPGQYQIIIQKEAYNTVDEKLRIYPGEGPVKVSKMLYAKPVLIRIQVSHNIQPPPNLGTYKVTLIDSTGVPRSVEDGNRITPGVYKLEIKQPGYALPERRELNIVPTEGSFLIKEELKATPRPISFEMIYNKVEMVKAVQIFVNGNNVTYADTFEPGKTYDIEAKFKDFKSVKTTTLIPPGEGPHIANIDLVKLTVLDVRVQITSLTEEVDGIGYKVKIFEDGNLVEEHHIKSEIFGRTIFFSISVVPDTRTIRIEQGYFFVQVNVSDTNKVLKLDQIDVSRLIDHLKSVNPNVALDRMDRIVNSKDISCLSSISQSDLDQLIQYVNNLGNFQDEKRKKNIIDKLKNVRK